MNLTVLLIAWLFCGFLTGAIASSKGHDFFGWFLLGCVIGIFGILAAAVVNPKHDVLEARQVAQGSSRICPFCAETIRSEAVVCRFCGRDVEPVEAMQGASALWGKCSQCSKPVRADATSCHSCGVVFAAPPETVP